jgi:uncharacterized protein (DUF2267 family)
MTNNIKSFEHGLRSSESWVHDLAQQTGWDNNHAYHILVSTLRTIRDRLPHEETAHLASQLPLIIRGSYYEGWRPAHTPEKYHAAEEFLERVARGVPGLGIRSSAKAVEQVMQFLDHHLSAGEIRHVLAELPGEISGLLEHRQEAHA